MAKVTIISPDERPFSGLACDRHPSACPPGMCPDVVNLIPYGGVGIVRWACEEKPQDGSSGLRSSGNLGATYGPASRIGVEAGLLGTFEADGWLYAAFATVYPLSTPYQDTIVASVFRTKDLVSWERVSGPSRTSNLDACGPLRQKRSEMVVYEAPRSSFAGCAVPRPFGKTGSLALWSVPADRPSVFSSEASQAVPRAFDQGYSQAVVQPTIPGHWVDTIKADALVPVSATFASWLQIPTGPADSSVSATGTGACTATAYQFSSSTVSLRIQVAASPSVGDYASFQWTGASMDLSSAYGLVLFASETYAPTILEFCSVEIGDLAGNWSSLHDPADGRYAVQTVSADCPENPTSTGLEAVWAGLSMLVFPLSGAKKVGSSDTDLSAVSRIRLRVTKAPYPNATQDLHIVAVCGSRGMPGGTQIAYSRASSFSGVESPALILPIGEGELLTSVGARMAVPPKIPLSDAVRYAFRATLMGPGKWPEYGVDTCVLYAKRPTDQSFYRIGKRTMANWNQAQQKWQFAISAPAAYSEDLTGLERWSYSTLVYAETQDMSHVAPDEYTVGPKAFQCCLYVGDRLWLGCGDTLWISDYREPMRFRTAARFLPSGELDTEQGTSHRFAGERILSIDRLDGPSAGSARVFVCTDRSIYVLDAAQPHTPPTTVGRFYVRGTKASCVHKDSFAWVGDAGHVRLYVNGGLMEASDNLVESWFDEIRWLTRGVPEDQSERVACSSDGRYLWFCVPQSSGVAVLLFDPQNRAWTRLEYKADIEETILLGRKMVGITRYGRVFDMKSSLSKDLYGTVEAPIPVELETPWFSAGWISTASVRGVLMASDPLRTEVAVRCVWNGGERPAAHGTAWGGSESHRWFPIERGVRASSVGVRIATEAPAGWRLAALAADVEQGTEGNGR